MKNKKQFTLIELIIVIVVIGILAAMALPKFNGVVRNAKLSAMINDKETLEKTLVLYYQKNDTLPLLNEDEELIISKEGISLSKVVLAEEAQNGDMDTIYTSLKETLIHYQDSEETLYRIDISKMKENLSKNIKYGHKKNDKDFYVYSTKTGNVYYYDYLVNRKGTIQHSEYDTLLKDNELVNKVISPSISEGNSNNEDKVTIQTNTISLGVFHSMKISEDGNLYSWGDNYYGQLGIGNTINQIVPRIVTLPNGEKPVSVASGINYSMSVTNKGNLYAWGKNEYGQLGIGSTTDQLSPTKVTIPNNEKPISIFLGYWHSIVITDKGNLYAWGYNYSGQLGVEDTIDKTTPQLVTLPNGEKPISIALGSVHSMVITNKGNLYAWGNNGHGQLGIGNIENQLSPIKVKIPNGETPISINVGGNHSMVITNKGNLYSWGLNNKGQLGIGNTINQLSPIKVTLPNGEIPISINSGTYYSMILTKNGNLYACGLNDNGQLGIGDTIDKVTPKLVNIPNGEVPISINAGGNHSITITSKGNIYTWGYNTSGQLGIGNTTKQISPIKVTLP